jgi:hypothetical protein
MTHADALRLAGSIVDREHHELRSESSLLDLARALLDLHARCERMERVVVAARLAVAVHSFDEQTAALIGLEGAIDALTAGDPP